MREQHGRVLRFLQLHDAQRPARRASVRTEPVRRPRRTGDGRCWSPKIPPQGPLALTLTAVLVAAAGGLALSRPHARRARIAGAEPQATLPRASRFPASARGGTVSSARHDHRDLALARLCRRGRALRQGSRDRRRRGRQSAGGTSLVRPSSTWRCLRSITLIWFALAWIFRSPRPPAMRIGFRASAAALLGRDVGDRAVRPAHGALSPGSPPIRRPRPAARAGAAPARRALQRGLDARPALGARRAKHSSRLHAELRPAARVDRAFRRPGRRQDRCDPARPPGRARVAIVGHSMGGLVARAYLRRHGPAKVAP